MSRADPVDGLVIDKDELRRIARSRRNAIEPDRRASWSALLCGHLRKRLEPGAVVMSYVAIRSEVDLAGLTAAGLNRILLPRVEGQVIVAVPAADEFGEPAGLVMSPFGVPEPIGPAVDPRNIDVVCVPGLAFDRHGGRLGYGAGYYDRFLPMLRPDAVTIAVGFSPQIVDEVPMHAHDHAVDIVITEQGVVGGSSSIADDSR